MPRPLRILCFGDSLTGGYTQSGRVYKPYHEALSRRLTTVFPGLELVIDIDGRNGGLTRDFQQRLAEAHRLPYDWVIVLGGTNDIAFGMSADAIFENLERTWTYARLKKSKVLALTVPEVAIPKLAATLGSTATVCRDRLNALIKGYAATDAYHVFDFWATFNYSSMSEDDRRRLWSDRVHFSAAGYDLMGEQIADALAEILKKEDDGAAGPQATTLSAVRPRSQKRKMFKDDDIHFDEEEQPLSQTLQRQKQHRTSAADDLRRGYIVVRRKDLD